MSSPVRKRGLCSRKEAAKGDSASHRVPSVREGHYTGEGGKREHGRGEVGRRGGGGGKGRREGVGREGGREVEKEEGMVGRKAWKVL